MSAAGAVALGLGTIALGGALPAWWTVRSPVRAIFLAIPAGLLCCGISASLTLLLPGSYLMWWFVTAVSAAVLTGWTAGWERPRRPTQTKWLTALAIWLTALLPASELRQFHLGWDTRSIWLLHARLLTMGHDGLVAGLTTPALGFSHPDYPLAGPGATALTWLVNATRDYRLAQVVTGLLTIAATAALGWELARLGRGRLSSMITTATGALVVVAAYAPFERWAVSGYMDPLWAALAAAAVVAGLAAPLEPASRRAAFMYAAAASLVKSDAMPPVVLIVFLTVLRYRLAKHGANWQLVKMRADLWAPIAVAGVLALWVGATRANHIASRFNFKHGFSQLLAGDPAITSRFAPMWTDMWHELPNAGAVMCVLLIGSLIARRSRRAVGLGAQSWLLVLFALSIAALIPPYLFDTGGTIHWLLDSSISRTTIFPYLLGVVMLAMWPITAARNLPYHQTELL